MNHLLAPQPTVTPDRLTMTPAEFGFVHQEQGPQLEPSSLNLPKAYEGRIEDPIHTQLLVTDQGNPVIVTSIIGANSRITRIAEKIETQQSDTHQYSDEIQGYFLKGVKAVTDEKGNGIKVVSNNEDTIYYTGNTGTSNGRLLRVYLAKLGDYEGIPIIAKVGASRTKESEVKLLRALGTKLRKGKV